MESVPSMSTGKPKWSMTYQEAVALQNRMRSQVREERLPPESIRILAAADVSFSKRSPVLYAAVLVYSFPDLQLIEHREAVSEAEFPYIPGLFFSREAPPLLPLFESLSHKPDVVLVDGQGVAHPRRFGIASHLGVLLDLPTIGCAKSRLVGEFSHIPETRGETVDLLDDGELIGKLVCTRSGTRPVYVSVGHRVTLDDAVEIVLQSAPKYRIPEPLRGAHQWVNRLRKSHEENANSAG